MVVVSCDVRDRFIDRLIFSHQPIATIQPVVRSRECHAYYYCTAVALVFRFENSAQSSRSTTCAHRVLGHDMTA